MQETRHQFHESLAQLERQTLQGLDLVIRQLDSALLSTSSQDVELAATVVAGDDQLDALYREIHKGALSLLARQTPVAGDLRLIAALLHIIRCIERMGDQCANIAKLVPLSGHEVRTDQQLLATIDSMGRRVHAQVSHAKEAFATRDLDVARELANSNGEINRLDREVFIRAVDIGDDLDTREWAMLMILVARCLERIAENTVDIGEQTLFVAIGLFREFEGASPL